MARPEDPLAELRKAIHDRRAVIVAGTGISIAASCNPDSGKPHPQASWAGLLHSGLEWLEEHNHLSKTKADAHRTLLNDEPDTYDFITTAQHVTRLMGGVDSIHFENWLKDTVGNISAHNREGLDALQALREHGNLLATTNYDGLLLDGSRTPVTWKEPNDFLRAARDKDVSKVLFLHGYWRNPKSVILDWTSYEQVTRDEQYRRDLEAVWATATWVYVGCGAHGLSDPDFGLLLERYGQRARQADLWDFCLVLDGEREEFQAHFDKLKINVIAVPFGKAHGDLPGFLRSLLPIAASTGEAGTTAATEEPAPAAPEPDSIPKPPAFYAEPDYIGSHQFVGRVRELEDISDWARPADPTNLLLYEAIGGNGKSMLTWEWTTKRATQVRDDWAGRFWYSFYERGAIMADFCQRALAYMTGRPLKEFRKKKTAELREPLLHHLHERPWLLILDGLERVLVAYHRIDAAEMRDEDADNPTDQIANRIPTDAIRDEDNDLLRALAAAAPSKILVSSRLTPRVLLNPSGQPINGAKRITLPGLRPADAEQLLRSCEIEGDSAAIQSYLAANCDNHPLVIGILGGLIHNYLPARDNFDAWVADPDGGAKLDLASLNLIQRRNHILRAALDALPSSSRQLLSTLALLSESVDYETLSAFDPNDPPDANKLAVTVTDLEQRGLLQYDDRTRRHDLHPVVRGVAAGGMKTKEKERYGQRVVDHFSSASHNPYEQAETLEDVRSALHIVHTLLKLGHFEKAAETYLFDIAYSLCFNLEAHSESLSLLRPFFPVSWADPPVGVKVSLGTHLAHCVAEITTLFGEPNAAIEAGGIALRGHLKTKEWANAADLFKIISNALVDKNLVATAIRMNSLARKLAESSGDDEAIFTSSLCAFRGWSLLNNWSEAEAAWQLLDPMGRHWPRAYYRPGDAELSFARFHYRRNTFEEHHDEIVEKLATDGKNRSAIRELHGLRGAWRVQRREWDRAATSLAEAVRMARENGIVDAESETGLALAKQHLGQLAEPQRETERLTVMRRPAHRYLAMLWRELGNDEQAEKHALKAYEWAWADGEPYVDRYELTKTTELLETMGVERPDLPPYDPAKDEPFPWEADVRAAIEKLRAEKETRETEKSDE